MVRPADLYGLSQEMQRSLLTESRPEAPDVRVSWWLGLVHQLTSEATRDGAVLTPLTRRERIDLAMRVTELAGGPDDLGQYSAAVLMVELGRQAWKSEGVDRVPQELSADSLAQRCLDAIRVAEADVPAIAARDRAFQTADGGRMRRPIMATTSSHFSTSLGVYSGLYALSWSTSRMTHWRNGLCVGWSWRAICRISQGNTINP
jgi:hypothetical protein